jgi:hypothetical protein
VRRFYCATRLPFQSSNTRSAGAVQFYSMYSATPLAEGNKCATAGLDELE